MAAERFFLIVFGCVRLTACHGDGFEEHTVVMSSVDKWPPDFCSGSPAFKPKHKAVWANQCFEPHRGLPPSTCLNMTEQDWEKNTCSKYWAFLTKFGVEMCKGKCVTKCPYGTWLPGDVTLPNNIHTMQVLALVWSFIPYVIAGLAAIEVAFIPHRRGLTQFSFVVFFLFVVCCNEMLIKPMVQQLRPGGTMKKVGDNGNHRGSCCITTGMPSSHASMACGALLLIVFESLNRVRPQEQEEDENESMRRILNEDEQTGPQRAGVVHEPEYADVPWDFLSALPTVPNKYMTRHNFMYFYIAWMIILLPVPFSRTILHDHTIEQITIGSTAGACYAYLFYVWKRRLLLYVASLNEKKVHNPETLKNWQKKLLEGFKFLLQVDKQGKHQWRPSGAPLVQKLLRGSR